LAWAGATSIALFVAAVAGIELSGKLDSTAALWPANAVLLAALLIAPRERWTAFCATAWLASVAANLVTHHPLASSLVLSVANVAEAAVAAALLARWHGRNQLLERVAGVTKLVLVAGLVAPAFSATLAAGGRLLLGGSLANNWWLRWFVGDALGLLIITPVLLILHRLWRSGGSAMLNGRSALEAAALLAGTTGAALWVFSVEGMPILFLALPLVLLAAFRLGALGAATASAIVAGIGFWATAHDAGPAMLFVGTDAERVLFLQLFLGVLFATSLPVAAALSERHLLATELRIMRDAARQDADDFYDLATTDELTGLASRRHFLERCEREAVQARATGRPLALALIDVDRFKLVNDTHGHPTGDAVLRSIGTVLRTALRPGDMAGRLGGEEIGLLMPGTGIEAARTACERLRASIAELAVATPTGATVSVSVSIGLAQGGSDDLEQLLAEADRALYAAKQQGRNLTVLAA
jgi:diguanylate cyclase (GGDEF)-like protein